MANINIFENDAFSLTSLTSFVNKKPHIPSMLRDMGLFEVKPVRTTTIWVEVKNGKITLIPTSNRGEPIFQNEKQKRDAVPLQCLRLAEGDTITADELQNIRAEGEEAELKEVQMEVNDRLATILGNIDLTEENLMLGAIQGILVDADGSTVIYNLYDKFGVTQPLEIDFDLDNASPAPGALKKKCTEVVRGMVRAGGNAMLPSTEIMAYCGDNFWDDLISHPEVQGAYNNWVAAQSMSNEVGVFKPFRWGEINWVNYRGTDDGSTVAIGADKVKFFPRGARGLFEIAYAPAEFMPYVNTRGQARYSMTIPDIKRQAYVEVEAYAYPLPYCTRPEVLFRGRRT
jgi:hypothetical protein